MVRTVGLILFILQPTLALRAQDVDTSDADGANEVVIKNFDGIYFAITAGSQNLFGGSFVNNMDVLAQDSRFATDITAGFRKQLIKGKLLVGIHYSFGFTDGNLRHKDPEDQLEIEYKNSTQRGLGGEVGLVAGNQKRHLFFAYVNETSRDFDVFITHYGDSYEQHDQQGMLKYGIGWEWAIIKGLHARASLGALRVDFGDLETNIRVDDKLDYMVGLSYQF